jgi:hypoxanthine phosphoribosyltransferase|tara:strand:- start:268 stop:846 length:579 start_codon:yes stop_codon:yes gene_type:complete
LSDSNDNKIFISEESQILDSYRLAEAIYRSGYRPTFIIGLWRGGSTVALVVQECLAYLGVPADHTTIRTSYGGRPQYERSISRSESIRVHGKSYALETLSANDRLLIVDDVFRSGRHIRAVVDQLRVGLRRNMPKELRVAALWKHTQSKSSQLDYFLHETDQWIVLPYELSGLSPEELREHKPQLSSLLADL